MSDNTSGTFGYLTPAATTNNEQDDALADILTAVVSGITGIDSTLVRPRWQPQPPTQPPVTTNWCAIGVLHQTGTDYPQIIHDPVGLGGAGSDTVERPELIEALASFYGPQSTGLCAALRDGLCIRQNLDTLYSHGIKMRHAEHIIHMPELINSQYVNRCDMQLSFVRIAASTFNVLNLISAEVDTTASGSANLTTVTVIPPTGR